VPKKPLKESDENLRSDELEALLKSLMIVAGAGLGITIGGLAGGWDHVPLRHGLICVLAGCLWMMLFTLASYVVGGLYLDAGGRNQKDTLHTATSFLIFIACLGFLVGIIDGWPAVRGKSTLFSYKIITEIDEYDYRARLERAKQNAEIDKLIRTESVK
jgi:hypothetical protein